MNKSMGMHYIGGESMQPDLELDWVSMSFCLCFVTLVECLVGWAEPRIGHLTLVKIIFFVPPGCVLS